MDNIKLHTVKKDFCIIQHGERYVDVTKDVHICPECFSSNVEESSKAGYGNLECGDCGCIFFEKTHTVRTPLGNVVEASLNVVTVLMIIAAIASFIAGVICSIKAGNSTEPTVILKCIGITLGLPFVFLAIGGCADEFRKSI